jgi:broad specificity phosphatase PhoE
MTLYLVRHGRAAAGVEQLDPGLDDVGKSQAEHVAAALRDRGARRLVSSPLRRARETAAPIAAALGLVPEIREEVSEVFDPTMTTSDRRAMLVPLLSGLWSAQPAELREWRDRVVRIFVELGRDRTIVVSHFVAISAAIGASTDDDRVSPCALANASITTLEVAGGRLVLRRPGEVAHLPPDEITATHAALPGR